MSILKQQLTWHILLLTSVWLIPANALSKIKDSSGESSNVLGEVVSKTTFKPQTGLASLSPSRDDLNVQLQQLKLFDEILTQSIRNYAFTKEEKWLRRYVEYQPKLDTVLATISAMYSYESSEFKAFGRANAILYQLEDKAIGEIKNGQVDAAIKILESSEYNNNKQIYHELISRKLGFNKELGQALLLTKEEQDWLSKHPIIRVQGESGFFPYNFYEQEPKGHSIDLMKELSQIIGVKFQVLPNMLWSDAMTNINIGNLDVIVNIVESEERSKTMLFTQSYLQTFNGLYIKKGAKKIKSLSSLNGKFVAMPHGYVEQELLERNYPEINILSVDNPIDAMNAVLTGDADATLSETAQVNYLLSKRSMQGLELSTIIKDKKFQNKFHLAVRKDWPELQSILNKALSSISAETTDALFEKWMPIDRVKRWVDSNLNADEIEWLNQHRTWRIGIDPSAQPFEYFDQQLRHSGVSSDYLKYVAEQLEVKLDYASGLSWSEVLEKSQRKEIDLLPLAVNLESRRSYLSFTKPYLSYPAAIVTRDNDNRIKKQRDLNNKRVAMIRNYPISEVILNEDIDIVPVYVDSALEAIKLVSSGGADALLMSSATATYQSRESNIANLKISAYADFSLPGYSMAIRNDWQPLVGILDKLLLNIPPEKKAEFNNRWVNVGYTSEPELVVELTQSEDLWLVKHPVLQVINHSNSAPFDFLQAGEPSGYSIDYVKLLGKKVGFQVEFVGGTGANKVNSLKSGQISLVQSASDFYTSQQDDRKYISPYKTTLNAIVVRSDSNDISMVADLQGRTVALKRGDEFADKIAQSTRNVTFLFLDDYEAVLKAVAFGAADAAKVELPVATYLIRKLSLTNLRIAGQISKEDGSSNNYLLAIASEQVELAAILEKAMASLTAEEIEALDRKWLTSSNIDNNEFEISKSVISGWGIFLIVFLILVGSLVLLVIFRLLDRSKQNPLLFQFSGVAVKKLAMIFNAVIIFIAILLSWWAINGLKEKITKDVLTSMQTILETTEKATTFWANDKLNSLTHIATTLQFQSLASDLLKLHEKQGSVLNSDELRSTRRLFEQTRQSNDQVGFFIISKEGISVGSSRNSNIGTQNLISTHRPDLFKRVLNGESLFIPPIPSDVPLDGKKSIINKSLPPTMFFATPIRLSKGNIIGVLAERYDPHGDFSRIQQLGKIGESGETYSVSIDGKMLSESRFLSQIRDVGLIGRDEQSILSIELRDPGGNVLDDFELEKSIDKLPLTKMALDLVQGNSGFNVQGYRNYRGVNVIGVWSWNETLGIGMATEIDFEESYQGYFQVRLVVGIILIIAISTSIILTLITMLLGSRANSALQKAHDTLEQRVRDRTIDLETSKNQLRSSEFRLQTVLDSVPAIMFLKDIDGKYLLVNSSFEKTFGIRKQDALGKVDKDLFSAEIAEISMGFDKYILAEGISKSFEDVAPNLDGDLIYYLATKVAIKNEDGEVNGLAGIAIDITERKHMEEKIKDTLSALHLSEERFELAMRGAKDGLWDWNLVTGEVFFSDRWYEMLGYKPGEIPASIEAWRAMCDISDVNRNIEKVEQCIKDGLDGYTIEYHIRHKLGHLIPVLSSAHAARDPHTNQVTRFVGTHRDLSEQREYEEKLKGAIEMANAANQAKSEFLATMSHEIRTPLNGVLGMLSLLLHTDLTADQNRKASIATKSAESLLSIINDILDFSKIEAGKFELESVDFNLPSLLEELAQTMSFKADEKDVELVLDITQVNVLWVMGDPSRLRQILINLIGNAIKFTESGEIVVRAKLVHKSDSELTLTCTVKDTGIGIPEDKLATLFDSFTQADTSTTRKYGGSGLGLAICKKLIELMGGDISVHSDSDVGSSFEFSISLLPAKTQRTSFPKIDMSQLHLLIVDDNVTNREIFSTLLQCWGAATTEVSSAPEALALCAEPATPKFDIALVDMHMPDMNGEMLASTIREDRLLDSMKLLLMTSMSKQRSNDEIKKMGFDGYLNKPVASSDLFNAITALTLQAKNLTESELVTEAVLERFQTNAQSVSSDGAIIWPSDLRILMVEDNQINQLVVKGMLEMLNLTCDVAGNGLEAIVSLKRSPSDAPYTLIFMDCQMPELDGYEATKRIRAGDAGYRYQSVPIVALTAHAMKDELDKCLTVGMNDFLSKPLDELDLQKALIKWSGTEKLPSQSESEGVIVTETPTRKATPPVWDEKELMTRLNGNQQLVNELMQLFLAQMPSKLSQLNSVFATSDRGGIREVAHAIKGMAGNLSAKELQGIATHLEQGAQQMPEKDLLEVKSGISSATSKLMETLNSFFDNDLGQQESRLPIDFEHVKSWLNNLKQKLTAGEFMAPDVVSEVESFEFNQEVDLLIKELKRQISVFDMDGALDSAKKIEDKL